MPSGLFHENYSNDERIFQTLWVKGWLWVFILFLFFGFPFIVSDLNKILRFNVLHTAILTGIFVIGAHGINILTGYTGQISLGHGAFMAVGAYTSAILMTKAGFPFILSLPCAGLLTAAVGMVFGVPSLRLRGLYLCIATLASQFIIEFTIRRWTGLTGGTQGMFVPYAAIGGFVFDNDRKFYYLVLVLAIATTAFTKNLFRTKPGRAFIAVRDRYFAAELIGVNLFKYRILSFGISSFLAGIAGALWAHYISLIIYEQFTIHLSIKYLAIVIIGGLGSVLGGIFGSIFYVSLEQLLEVMSKELSTSFPLLITYFVSIKEIMFGLIIILFLIFEPDGLAARWRTVKAYWKLWPFSY
jgi:branched-chain amino acid transport system permease protein